MAGQRRLVPAHRGRAPSAVLCVAPATANTLAKMAAGLADNLLTAVYLAFRGRVVIAPAMNWAMYEHPATQENLRSSPTVAPRCCATEQGDLACGEEGSGRMADPETILLAIRRAFNRTAAGPLRRTARWSSRPGARASLSTPCATWAIAPAAGWAAPSPTRLTCAAPTSRCHHRGPASCLPARDRRDRRRDGRSRDAETADADVLVMAAAVADFTPRAVVTARSSAVTSDTLALELVRTEDILAATRPPRPRARRFRGRGRPTSQQRACQARQKGVDLLVFNDILAGGVGIGSDENEITIITPQGDVHVPRTSKVECARAVMTEVQRMIASR